MTQDQIATTAQLWAKVEELRDGLRAAGSAAAADRLQTAMTISGHPGEVWPATRDVLRELTLEAPSGLDGETAAVCSAYLDGWP